MSAQLLLRKRLINLIDSAADHVIYLQAPSGFGKTILAQQWAQAQQLPTVWFQSFKTANSSDILEALVTEISKVLPVLGKALYGFIGADLRDADIQSEFIATIGKSSSPFNLIIENAELIRASHNEFARFLVGNLPDQIKLILITETSPRTSFLQEYGLNRFSIISQNDLSFTREEMGQLAIEIGVELSAGQLSEIYTLVQGWPVGVHIALSQVAVTRDISGLIASIRGKGEDQFSVASKRILANLKTEELTLLTDVSLLEKIDVEAVFALTDNVDSIRILTLLSQDTMVVEQHGFNPPLFTIHPLLKKILVDDFQRDIEFKTKSETLVNFLIEKGRIQELTNILLQLGEVKKLSELLQEPSIARQINLSIQESISRASIPELANWLEVATFLPILKDVASLVLNFYIALLQGNFSNAAAQLSILKSEISKLDNDLKSNWLIDAQALDAILDYAYGRLTSCFENAIGAFESSIKASSSATQHQITYLQLALWASVISDDDIKVKKISAVMDSKFFKKNTANRSDLVHAMRALIAAHEGRFVESKNELLIPMYSSHANYFGFFAPFGVFLSEFMITSEAGDHEKGMEILKNSLEKALNSSNYPMALTFFGRLSYQHILLGDTEEALSSISKARALISEKDLSEELHFAIDVWEARIRYWVMDHKRAHELMARSQVSYLMRAFKAGTLINSDSAKKALEITETFDLTIPRQELTYHLFRAHIFHDSPAMQLEEVRKAVSVGSKHGYFKHFLTQRSDVIQQYISLVAESPTPFNERLARAAGIRLNEMMVGNQNAGESLTRREADILRHLGTGLAITQIASDLCISKNTMKTHLKNIYRKLGATGRADAVEKGKKLLKV